MFNGVIRHPYLAVFALALAVRLLNIAALPLTPQTILAEDATIYWNGAGVLLEHGRAGSFIGGNFVPETERMPGYIYFLAAMRYLTGDSFALILASQAVLDALTCMLVAATGALLSTRTAFVSGLFAALWPNLIIHAGMLLSDSLFLFFFAGMLAGGARFLANPRYRWAAVAGICLGCAIMTRPVAQFLPFLMLPIAFGVAYAQRKPARHAAMISCLFLAAALLPLAPWLHRNITQFDAYALTSQSGKHLAGWVVPLVRRTHDGTPRNIGEIDLNREYLANGTVPPGNTFEANRHLASFALSKLSDYPPYDIAKAWITGAAMNLATPPLLVDIRVRSLPHASFDRTQGDGVIAHISNFLSGSSLWYVVFASAGFVFSALMSGAQLLGAILLARRLFWPFCFAFLCVSYFLAINGPVASPKYRLPFEPVLIIWCAIAFEWLWSICVRCRRD